MGLPDGALFLPQKPYMCLGTLRDQVTFPQAKEDVRSTTEELELALIDAQLPGLVQRFVKKVVVVPRARRMGRLGLK